jgi:hypothetical protein
MALLLQKGTFLPRGRLPLSDSMIKNSMEEISVDLGDSALLDVHSVGWDPPNPMQSSCRREEESPHSLLVLEANVQFHHQAPIRLPVAQKNPINATT